ncbi:MAG: peptidoglycan editing factor PgeF, partial [Syntrophales bacterium]|nr:peptidoglycan editing factor PgeF [Syntrophales bacterium]
EKHSPFVFVMADILKEQAFLVHAFGTRNNNGKDVMRVPGKGEAGAEDAGEDGALAGLFRIERRSFYTGIQVHGDHIAVLDEKEPPTGTDISETKCDALVTNRSRCAIGIRTADCVPLLLADPVNRVVGAVHAGWKGTALGIAGKAADLFVERFSSDPSNIIAAIGPSIGPCCYEVGDDVFEEMCLWAWRGEVFSDKKRNGRRMMNLGEASRRQLLDAGIPEGNIAVLPLCTLCRNDLFYSWRGEGNKADHQVSGIMLA